MHESFNSLQATPKSPTFLLGDRPKVEFKGALPEVETDHAHRKATLFDLQLCRFCAHERGQQYVDNNHKLVVSGRGTLDASLELGDHLRYLVLSFFIGFIQCTLAQIISDFLMTCSYKPFLIFSCM